MAQIVINEISQNYTYNIGKNSFATVALPITAMWGPAFEDWSNVDEEKQGSNIDEMLETTQWKHFPATQQGLESFVSTYRGPSANYKLAKDYSYQMAMTLLTAGYDVLVCRVCPGGYASAAMYQSANSMSPGNPGDHHENLRIRAKYPGTFGNNLKVVLKKIVRNSNPVSKPTGNYWNIVVYVVDQTGIQTAVETKNFVFDVDNSTDSIPHIDEVESDFITISSSLTSDSSRMWEQNDGITDNTVIERATVLADGDDSFSKLSAEKAINKAKILATQRYTNKLVTESGIALGAGYEEASADYISVGLSSGGFSSDQTRANTIMYREWCYTSAFMVYQLLKDKLNYNPQRIISPGWDDQDFGFLDSDQTVSRISKISPLHKIIMETAYYSRCATGMLDIPRSCPRKTVYNTSTDASEVGYAQMLSRIGETLSVTAGGDANSVLYCTHSALFAPWGQYQYVGTGKQNLASPAFIALMIQRAQILNQSLQYEWALPTNRKHNLKLGKFDYKVPKKLLDVWQKLEGVGVNVLTEIPELGVNLWGNSTLYEVPPATYQALANLSTRYLVNAVEDIAYKCGISITFQYNNEQAYNKFYAGVTPTLDTMKNVGAIDDYYVKMAADINGLDQVNANTVIGKIYLVVNGVINDIIIDLIALPPGTDLNQYKS